MKHLTITGGLGFIGKNFYKRICNEYEKILILDKNTYASDYEYFLKIKRDQDNLVIGDITDTSFLNKNIIEDTCLVHFAAESHVDNSFKNSILFTFNNTYGTHLLLENAKEKRTKKIIIISTDEVYGQSSVECDEYNPMYPSNPYSSSKAGADLIAQSYFKSFNLPIVIVRPNNVYGPRQNAEKLIPAIIRAIHGGKKLSIHGNGETSRFFLHVDDLTDALKIIIQSAKDGSIFNINGKHQTKVINLVKEAAKYMNVDVSKFSNYADDRPFNDLLYSINGASISSLGWNERKVFDLEFKKLIDEKSYIE